MTKFFSDLSFFCFFIAEVDGEEGVTEDEEVYDKNEGKGPEAVPPVKSESMMDRKICTIGSKVTLKCKKPKALVEVEYTWIKDDDKDWFSKVAENRDEVSKIRLLLRRCIDFSDGGKGRCCSLDFAKYIYKNLLAFKRCSPSRKRSECDQK